MAQKLEQVYERKNLINIVITILLGGLTPQLGLLVEQTRVNGAPRVGGVLFLVTIAGLIMAFLVFRYYYYNSVQFKKVIQTEVP